MSTSEDEIVLQKQSVAGSKDDAGPASVGELFLAGPVLSICSPSFYRHAVTRSAFVALAFFVMFGAVVAVLQGIQVTSDFGEARAAIDDAFASGVVPEVIIADGQATVLAPQPFVAVDDGRSLVVLDTTGEYTGRELREGGYVSGFILTRDTVYGFDDQGRPTQLSLRELDRVFPWTIHFNASFLQRFIDLAQGSVFLGLLIWRAVLGPLYIAILALGVWAFANGFKRDIDMGAVLVTGFFAAVPALYAEYLLARVNLDVFLLYTLILFIIWTVALVSAVGTRRPGDVLRGERTLRAWRALIGIPMLIIFALDVVYRWPNGPQIIWVTAAITVTILLVVGYLTGIRQEEQELPGKLAKQS